MRSSVFKSVYQWSGKFMFVFSPLFSAPQKPDFCCTCAQALGNSGYRELWARVLPRQTIEQHVYLRKCR